MKRAEPVDLDYTRRYGVFVAQYAIQDFFDLLVELLTNCDDSYHGLCREGLINTDGGPISIEVVPHRGDKQSRLIVKDRAAGFRNLAHKIRRVGERTSNTGDRGFMARGLKECAALGHVTVETIYDNRYDKAEITPAMKLIEYVGGRKSPGETATQDHRKRLGISRGNGTKVTIDMNPSVKVPRLETLKRDLPWHFALRDMMSGDSSTKIKIIYSDSKPETLYWTQPEADLIHDREYPVPGYDGARFRFRLWKSPARLEDPVDKRCRRTGIVVKGTRAIHGVTFLAPELENDPASDFFFGRIECDKIDTLAEEYDDRVERGESQHPEDNPMLALI